jgi:hypothetical protein
MACLFRASLVFKESLRLNSRYAQPSVSVQAEMLLEALCFIWHNVHVRWAAYFHPRFKAEFDELAAAVQDELLASLVPLQE